MFLLHLLVFGLHRGVVGLHLGSGNLARRVTFFQFPVSGQHLLVAARHALAQRDEGAMPRFQHLKGGACSLFCALAATRAMVCSACMAESAYAMWR